MKRSMFDEIMEGLQSLRDEREGKITLKTYTVEMKQPSEVSSTDLLALRNRLNLSRAVFARYLRVNVRTLENWEQGRAKPNAQAALLIRLVAKHKDMLKRLQEV
jgi:putative transcriptional regulator